MRIVVADNNSIAREAMCNALEADGHIVLRASDGTEALQMLVASPVDLLIANIEMPGMDGMALLAALPALPRIVPTVIISGKWTPHERAHAASRAAMQWFEQGIVNITPLMRHLKELLK